MNLSQALGRVAMGTHIKLTVNANQVEKFQGKAIANSSMLLKAQVEGSKAVAQVIQQLTAPLQRIAPRCDAALQPHRKTSTTDGPVQLSRQRRGSTVTSNFECKVTALHRSLSLSCTRSLSLSLLYLHQVFRMKAPDKDVHIMWARKYAAELCVNLRAHNRTSVLFLIFRPLARVCMPARRLRL